MECIGPYTLIRRLATGGMAEVFLARQSGIEGFERAVVIKRILPHRAQNQEYCTMFLDEARLIARLNHPHIAQTYDLGEKDGSYYIVMEHVQGVDLSDLFESAIRIGTPGLPLPVSIAVISALCQALEYIHTRTDELGQPLKIVHRDLNPKNVILSYDGAVKLIDFGIAKAASHVYETRTGVIKGTYGYMAPEQVNRSSTVDFRADLFALGVLTYELTTGIHPFDAPDEVTVLGKLVRCQFQPPSRKIKNYPKTLDRLVVRCMSLDPKSRPNSAHEVLSLIEQFALEQKIPLTMSRIAQYVQQNHAEHQKQLTQIPPLDSASGDTPAMISARLALRADIEIGSAANNLLSAPLKAAKLEAQRDGENLTPEGIAVESELASSWPWARWGFRERIVASVAILVSLFATVSSVLLLLATLQPIDRTFTGQDLDADVESSMMTTNPNSTGGLSPSDAFVSAPTPQKIEAKSIRVTSEPPHARIFVDGKATQQLTPATVDVPQGKGLVWIRVELEGYGTKERQVATAAGEAVFSLTPEDIENN